MQAIHKFRHFPGIFQASEQENHIQSTHVQNDFF